MQTVFFGQVIIDSSNSSITVNTLSNNIAEGAYYIWHPIAAHSLLDAIADKITEMTLNSVEYGINDTDKIYFTLDTSMSVELGCQESLGFDAGAHTGTTITAENETDLVFAAGKFPSDLLTPVSSQGLDNSINSQKVANDSTVYTQYFGSFIDNEMLFKFLPTAKVNSIKAFWNSTMCKGTEFVICFDWPTKAHAYEYVCQLTEKNRIPLKRTIQGLDLYWTFGPLKVYGV